MAGRSPTRAKDLPWQHDIFYSLSRMLKCKIHISSVDGVLVLKDLRGGQDVIGHRGSVVRYLNHLYGGLEGVLVLVEEDSGWSAIDTRDHFKDPPVIPVTEKTLAGALATINYLHSKHSTPSRWAH